MLSLQTFHIGDDLGYMFADSALHGGDGKKISSFTECITTQTQHYVTSNGRFLVHVLVQSLVSLIPDWLYSLLNALVYTLLWDLICRLSLKERSFLTGIGVWGLMWILLPDVGLVAFSITSFSVNYLWTSVAILALLMWCMGNRNGCDVGFWVTVSLAFVAGTLQESFSLPLLASALLLIRRMNRREKLALFSFAAGTAVCVLAPGNFNRVAGRSGDLFTQIASNSASCAFDLLHTPVTVLFVAIVALWLIDKGSVNRILADNQFFFYAIVFSLLMDLVAYNASRQLWAPSVYALILLVKVGVAVFDAAGHRELIVFKSICGLVGLTCLALTAGAMFLRGRTYRQYNQFVTAVQNMHATKTSLVSHEGCESNYVKYPILAEILKGYAPDPWQRNGLMLSFDANTKKGLSRLYLNGKGKINTVLPYTSAEILRRYEQKTDIHRERLNDTVIGDVIKLDDKYMVIRTTNASSKSILYIETPDGVRTRPPFEQYYRNGYLFRLIPAIPGKIIQK